MASNENLTITNETQFLENPFSDPINETTYEVEESIYRQWVYFYAAFEILKFIICLCVFIGDIYFIVIMIRFKKLRNRINNFILVYICLNVAYLVFVNTLMIIIEFSFRRSSYELYCLINNLDHLIMTLSFYSLAYLAFDWYFLNYHPNIYSKFPKTYGVVIALLIFAVPKWITSTVMCMANRWKVYYVRFSLEGVSFIACSILLISLAVMRKFKTPVQDIHKTEYAFTIPAVAFALTFPSYLTRLINLFAEDCAISKAVINYLYLLEYTAECFFLAQPIVVLYLLGKLNKYFKTAHLKCCKKNVRNYDDEDLDSGSINEVPESNVTFDKNSERLDFKP